MPIVSPGIGSGLDVNGIIQQLIAVERQPLAALDTREAGFQAKITAYGTLKGSVSSFHWTPQMGAQVVSVLSQLSR